MYHKVFLSAVNMKFIETLLIYAVIKIKPVCKTEVNSILLCMPLEKVLTCLLKKKSKFPTCHIFVKMYFARFFFKKAIARFGFMPSFAEIC